MFGIDAVEFVLILVVAILLFGPEKMPEYSRKAARIFVYLRGIANNTQNTLRRELGPEYADLELTDLNPKTFIKKHLSQEIAAIEEAKRDIEQMKQELKEAADQAGKTVRDAKAAAKTDTTTSEQESVYAPAPFDSEAT